MAIYRYGITTFLILVSVCVVTHSEIHRTKSNWSKTPNRQKSATGNSYVANPYEKEGEFNNTQASSEDMIERFEVWAFSILGAILVGLSGIFPLLIIPIEAGPSLHHGGKSYLSFILAIHC